MNIKEKTTDIVQPITARPSSLILVCLLCRRSSQCKIDSSEISNPHPVHAALVLITVPVSVVIR